MRIFSYAFLALFTLACSGCKPCGCSEATLVGGIEGASLKISFETSILPWVKDKFTITIIKEGSVRNLHGTYKETDKTIRFDVDGNESFLSVKSGEINSLECDIPRDGEFTVTPPAGAGVAVPLVFHCTKK
jgi:hypothetical protein